MKSGEKQTNRNDLYYLRSHTTNPKLILWQFRVYEPSASYKLILVYLCIICKEKRKLERINNAIYNNICSMHFFVTDAFAYLLHSNK